MSIKVTGSESIPRFRADMVGYCVVYIRDSKNSKFYIVECDTMDEMRLVLNYTQEEMEALVSIKIAGQESS